MPDHNVDWETCADDGCIGVRLPTSTKCWAHAVDTELELAFKRLGEHGLLDARGVLITQELLRRLLAAAPHDDLPAWRLVRQSDLQGRRRVLRSDLPGRRRVPRGDHPRRRPVRRGDLPAGAAAWP